MRYELAHRIKDDILSQNFGDPHRWSFFLLLNTLFCIAFSLNFLIVGGSEQTAFEFAAKAAAQTNL